MIASTMWAAALPCQVQQQNTPHNTTTAGIAFSVVRCRTSDLKPPQTAAMSGCSNVATPAHTHAPITRRRRLIGKTFTTLTDQRAQELTCTKPHKLQYPPHEAARSDLQSTPNISNPRVLEAGP